MTKTTEEAAEALRIEVPGSTEEELKEAAEIVKARRSWRRVLILVNLLHRSENHLGMTTNRPIAMSRCHTCREIVRWLRGVEDGFEYLGDQEWKFEEDEGEEDG